MTIVAGTVTTTTVPNMDAIKTPIETLKLKKCSTRHEIQGLHTKTFCLNRMFFVDMCAHVYISYILTFMTLSINCRYVLYLERKIFN